MATETLATRGRTQSTFYLDGTQHGDEGNEGCSLAEEELFGDDWSSTDDEDAFVEQHQQQGSIDTTEGGLGHKSPFKPSPFLVTFCGPFFVISYIFRATFSP